jgi:hypothetical protein
MPNLSFEQAFAGHQPPVANGGYRVGCLPMVSALHTRGPAFFTSQSFITSKSPMAADLNEDPTFFDRADSHIHLANEHSAKVGRGKVSASLMYGSARFQAWNAACWADDAARMKAGRQETLEYFVDQYRAMLEENLDDYIEKFDQYMRKKDEGAA